MLIIDRKGFRVMSILHRTYRVTRLRVIYLLNTRQGIREKVTENVSETTEEFREREHRKSFGKTEKLFRNILLGQKGFRHCMEIIRGSQNWSGNFWEFSERKNGNVPKLP